MTSKVKIDQGGLNSYLSNSFLGNKTWEIECLKFTILFTKSTILSLDWDSVHLVNT